MNLSVGEVARAVGKNENYVRQHIHRRHLAVQRQGRSVSVVVDEAIRWAAARGLPFSPPDTTRMVFGAEEERTARLTVLAWTPANASARNLFTLMRHRRREALGPWSEDREPAWSEERLGDELVLFSFNALYGACQEHLDRILKSGKLGIHGRSIHYALEADPRNHWAYRDYRRRSDASIRSPFSTHSAAITEYWSFAQEPYGRWVRLCHALPPDLEAGLRRLGFPLDERPERVGNLVVAAAEDAITCRLTAHEDLTLRLQVEATGLLPSTYRATIWASHSGDEVLRRDVPVTAGQTLVELATEVDRTGFAICRGFDGQYVDLVENLPVAAGRHPVRHESPLAPRFRAPRHPAAPRVRTPRPEAGAPVHPIGSGNRLDQGIRQQWLRRVALQREAGARRDAGLVRFRAGRFGEAAEHFLGLLSATRDPARPIYLADPCFVGHTMADEVAQFFVDLCVVVQNRPLRVLCAEPEPDDAPPWWAQYVRKVEADVTVRTFVSRSDERGCFHDRYLITPEREILMTNSFNGWNRYGVTFLSLPYGVYRAEAEELWALDVESPTADILVREIA